jgi:glucose/arabinose dehydrogenase
MRRARGTCLLAFAAACLACAAPKAADQPSEPRTGAAAYGDWTSSAIGVARLIRPEDMPAPYATSSAANPSRLAKRQPEDMPQVPPGFSVSLFVSGIESPRQIRVAPNGDIFLAESGAGRIRVIHAAPGATKADEPAIFADHLPHRPYGIDFYPLGAEPRFVYVATEGEVMRFPYRAGETKSAGAPEIVVPRLPIGHHWTRDLVFSPDGRKMLVAVGSGTNDAENGMATEKDRADILEFNPDGTGQRVFASGLRNPVSLAFYPGSSDLYTTVNERDGLGDNLPPDYVTRVAPDGFYGWPWYYIGGNQDPRYMGQHPELQDHVLVPDVLFQPHSAPLGLAVYTGKQFPQSYRGDLFVALHGSWNRAQRTGYKIVHVPVRDGKPTGAYEDFAIGFVTKEGHVWGRPVGVAVAADGALLVSDDGSGIIWRIAYGAGKPGSPESP